MRKCKERRLAGICGWVATAAGACILGLVVWSALALPEFHWASGLQKISYISRHLVIALATTCLGLFLLIVFARFKRIVTFLRLARQTARRQVCR